MLTGIAGGQRMRSRARAAALRQSRSITRAAVATQGASVTGSRTAFTENGAVALDSSGEACASAAKVRLELVGLARPRHGASSLSLELDSRLNHTITKLIKTFSPGPPQILTFQVGRPVGLLVPVFPQP